MRAKAALERAEAWLSRAVYGRAVTDAEAADLRAVVALAKEAEALKRLGVVCAKCDASMKPPRAAKPARIWPPVAVAEDRIVRAAKRRGRK